MLNFLLGANRPGAKRLGGAKRPGAKRPGAKRRWGETSVSARVRFLRFRRNKLTADALTVCLCVFRDAHKNSSENETPSSLCAEI